MPTSCFQPIRLLDPGCWYKFKYWMANSVDPDQLALDLHFLQRQDIAGFSRTRVNAWISTLGKIFSRWQIDYWTSFLIFPGKPVLRYHANWLQWRQFAWNVKFSFLRKIRKNILNLSSAELAQRVVMVNIFQMWQGLNQKRRWLITLCLSIKQ